MARFNRGRSNPDIVRTDSEHPVTGGPQRPRHGDAGRTAPAGHEDGQCGHQAAVAPVIPVVDSMTGRIFFSSAS
ncbi:hypothetical protein D3C73_1447180 [compost metagenome]